MSGVFIAGCDMYIPEQAVTNDDLAEILDTSDEWINQRTGIRKRRFSSGEMGAITAREALNVAGVSGKEIDMIIGCTCTPDYNFPTLPCIIQD